MKTRRVKVGPYKTVWQGEIFAAQTATAILPSGKKQTWERIVRPASVIVLAVDSHGRLLLTREYRISLQGYSWRVPGGRVDRGETPRAAAQRELEEEVGYRAKQLKLLQVANVSQTMRWARYVYLAKRLTPVSVTKDESEDITVIPTLLAKAFNMVVAGKIENDIIAYAICRLYWERKKLI